MKLEILYEDDALVFINKPPGLVVQQRMFEPDEPFLHDLVMRHTNPAYLMQRLDRGTSGVIFFSKNSDYNVRLTRQFEKKKIRKRYLAICEGELGETQTIDAPIARIGAIKFAVREDVAALELPQLPEELRGTGGTPRNQAKRAITHVAPRASAPSGSLVDIVLETGRTHQIRVHLSAIGHALAGDWLYGEKTAGRPMLHAAELEMTHPATGQALRVAAPVPDDFREEAMRRGIASFPEDRTDAKGYT